MDKRDVGAPDQGVPSIESLQDRLVAAFRVLDWYHVLDLVELAEAMARGEETKIIVGEEKAE